MVRTVFTEKDSTTFRMTNWRRSKSTVVSGEIRQHILLGPKIKIWTGVMQAELVVDFNFCDFSGKVNLRCRLLA